MPYKHFDIDGKTIRTTRWPDKIKPQMKRFLEGERVKHLRKPATLYSLAKREGLMERRKEAVRRGQREYKAAVTRMAKRYGIDKAAEFFDIVPRTVIKHRREDQYNAPLNGEPLTIKNKRRAVKMAYQGIDREAIAYAFDVDTQTLERWMETVRL